MTLPNFIVIGAAKGGTTALYWYLAEHPQVFMSRRKETNFFAYGLGRGGQLLYGDPELHRFPVRSLCQYEELFADAGDARAIGEASPIYLECPQAAARIRAVLPSARILCNLRNPVDRAYSDYQMYLRRRGRRLDPDRDLTAASIWARPDSHWMRISKYSEALSRYYDAFPRDRIHVFLFDELRRDPRAFVRHVYRSLDVDPDFVPDLDTPHNIGGVPASMSLERVFASRALRAVARPFLPKRAADRIRHLRRRNLRRAPALPAALRSELLDHFREDIAKTSDLIGRSLEHWG